MENNQIPQAVSIIDQELNKIKRKRGDSLLGFYGIAHTPLLFRIGYLIGDQSNVLVFHKTRSNDSKFTEWSRDRGAFIIETPKEYNSGIISKDLIVSISTTFEIKYEELTDLKPQDKHVLMFTANNFGFDVIQSNLDATIARDMIYRNIRDIVKKYDIDKIHFAISSSAAFTFFLGMGYSKQHDPDCIVYHYQRPHYPWGITIRKGRLVKTNC